MSKIEHLLVVRLSAMGDVALSVPVLRAFVKKYPHIKITVLSKPFLKPLFANIPNVTFYAADVRGKHQGFFGIFKLYRELKRHKIDAVADLHNVLRSKILRTFFRFSSTKIAFINKGRKEKSALTRSQNKVFNQLKTTPERYADVFRSLGFPLDLSHPDFPKKQSLNSTIFNIPKTKKNDIWIGIAPFATYSSKMYPLDLMEKVIADLSKQNNFNILLFGGGKNEVEILSKLADNQTNTISVAGKFKLDEELALISNLDAMLSMDSGNAHFAAMFGIPTITLWGATHPFTGFAPFNQPPENAIIPDLKRYPNIPCSIYGNKVCEGYENAMHTILPETVVSKILSVVH